MAAEPVGTAYVIIRAITSQLSKDIKDGLDKGSKDADTDAAGRELGRSVGESAGEEFGDTWNESSSEGIRDSADSRETRKAQDDYSESLFGRFRHHFDRGGRQMSESFNAAFSDSIDDDDLLGGIDIDTEHAGSTIGASLGHSTAHSFDTTMQEDTDRNWRRRRNDRLSTGASGFAISTGEKMAESTTTAFFTATEGAMKGFSDAMSAISIPGGTLFTGLQLALPLVGGALQTIGALAGEAVAAIGFVGTAAAGAAIAGAGIGAALIPAFLGIKAAFSVDTPLLDEFNDHMEEFNAHWEAFGFAVQETLLPHLMTAMDTLEELIPIFATYGTALGDIVGLQAEAFAEQLTTSDNKGRIASILDSGLGIVNQLAGVAVTLVTPILQILEAAMPIAQQLADAIGRVTDKFARWIDMKSKSGELTATFQKWYDRFVLIMDILGNLGGVFADIFGLGADSADGMFESLDKITQKWEDWTNSAAGQNKIKDFFENAKAVAGPLFGIVSDLLGILFKPMFETGGTQGLVDFFNEIRDFWIPTLKDWATVAKDQLSGPVGDFFKAIGDFLRTLADNPAIVGGFFSIILTNFFIFSEAIKLLSAALKTDIAKKFGPLILKMVFFGKVAGVFVKAGMKLIKFGKLLFQFGKDIVKVGKAIFTGLKFIASGLKIMGAAMKAFVVSNPIIAIIILIIAALVLLYFHFKPFRDFVDKYILDPIQRLFEKIGGFKGIMDFLKGVGEAILNFLIGVGKGIVDFFMSIPWGAILGVIITAWDGLTAAARAVWNFISGTVVPFFQSVFAGAMAVAGAVIDIFAAAWDAIVTAAKAVYNWIKDTLLPWLGSAFSAAWDAAGGVIDIFAAAWDGIVWAATIAWNFIKDKVIPWLGGAFALLMSAAGTVISGFAAAWDGIVWFATIAWNFIKDKIMPFLAGAFRIAMDAAALYIGVYVKAWDLIVWAATIVWNFIKDKVLPFFAGAFRIAMDAAALYIGVYVKAWDLIVWAATIVWNFIKDKVIPFFEGAFKSAMENAGGVVTIFKDGWDAFLDLLVLIYTWVKDTFVGVWQTVSDAVTGATDIVKAAWEGVKTSILTVVNTIIDGINFLIGAINKLPGPDIPLIPKFDVDTGQAIAELKQEDITGPFTTYFQEQMTAAMGGVSLGPGFEQLQNDFETRLGSLRQMLSTGQIVDAEQFVSNFGDVGSLGGQALVAAINTAMADGKIDDAEAQHIIDTFGTAVENGSFTAVTNGFASGLNKADWAKSGQIIADGVARTDFKKTGEVIATGVKTSVENEVKKLPPVVLPPLPNLEDDQGVVSAWAADSSGTIVKQLNDKLGGTKPAKFVKSVKSVTKSLADKLGDQDRQLIEPTNKFVDRVLLTLARLVKEVQPKVLNPFTLQVVAGINQTATLATAAMNKLVDRVMLTLARLVVETPRIMTTFGLAVALGMNAATTAATRAATTLVNSVVSVLGTLTGRMTNILAPAGVRAAEGLANGFKLGLAGFINTLRNLDTLIVGAVGNLNSTLFNAGVQLINGLILGMASRIDDLRVEVGIARGLATSILANGGIINQPTLAVMGEAGAEAVIPLTRPIQAMRVMRQAGLDQMVLNSTGTPSASSASLLDGATDVSILRIDHADIFDKVDVDIIAARMKSAYKSLPGR
jgi:phage-related protein